MRMELLLLLQELQQESTTQQQLLSPLPFPTTLPLVSSSIASAKTVVADPDPAPAKHEPGSPRHDD